MTNREKFVWTLEEIKRLPEFGNDSGWFYGLVRNHETGHIGLYEIFPGLGYADAWQWRPDVWWMMVVDIWTTPRRKAWHGFSKRRRV